MELQECTFKPNLEKKKNSTNFVYVKNREKAIERMKKARKQREFVNQVKERGYPEGVSWNNYMQSNNRRTSGEVEAILCIDLILLNEQHSIDVYEGQHLPALAQKISN